MSPDSGPKKSRGWPTERAELAGERGGEEEKGPAVGVRIVAQAPTAAARIKNQGSKTMSAAAAAKAKSLPRRNRAVVAAADGSHRTSPSHGEQTMSGLT